MATGIQTSVHRGKRSGISPRSPEKTQGQKAWSFLSQLSRKVKFGILGGIVALLFLGGLGSYSVQSNHLVDLYPLKLSTEDVKDVSVALIDFGMEHEVTPTQDGILIHPKLKRTAQARLAELSLPRHRGAVRQDSNPWKETSDERKRRMLRELESELVHTIRALDGITDARVQLAIPVKTYFVDDSNAAKASVYLKVANGERLDIQKVSGIASLVAHSVPDLDAENVSILDSQGFEINTRKDDGSAELEIQELQGQRLEAKLQNALSHIYGESVHAVVDLTLDFSQEEQRRYTPGGASDDGIVKDSFQLIHEVLEGASVSSEKNYDQKKEAVNYKYTENYFARLSEKARIQRITATVLVDGATEDEVKQISGIVMGAIGMDESRGDTVFVCGLPWNHKIHSAWSDLSVDPLADKSSDQPQALTWALACLAGLLLSIAAGAALTRRTKPILTVEPGQCGAETTSGIVDHRHDKIGTMTQVDGTTGRHGSRMHALEQLVGEEPNHVAKLLRTTWLS